MAAPEEEVVQDAPPDIAAERPASEVPETPNAAPDVAAAAREAASEGTIRRGRAASPWLLAGLDRLSDFLQAATVRYRTASGGEALSHAAEWLLDNAHLAHQAVREIRQDMPRHFYDQLPLLAEGPLAGYPRIFDISQRLISAGAARLDLNYARQFLQFYQEGSDVDKGAPAPALTTGELDRLAHALSAVTGLPGPPALPSQPLPGAATPDELVGNGFISLRAIATHDWHRFFEAVSLVEATFRGDPAGIYAVMDRDARPVPQGGRGSRRIRRPRRAGRGRRGRSAGPPRGGAARCRCERRPTARLACATAGARWLLPDRRGRAPAEVGRGIPGRAA